MTAYIGESKPDYSSPPIPCLALEVPDDAQSAPHCASLHLDIRKIRPLYDTKVSDPGSRLSAFVLTQAVDFFANEL